MTRYLSLLFFVAAACTTDVSAPIGVAGPAGTNGADGISGAIGPQGPKGAQGPQGPQGDTGLTGPQGPAGEAGAIGPAGPQGAPGAQGKPGVSVSGVSLAIGNPMCPTGGVRLIASDGDHYLCNGIAGAAGAQGQQGSQGPQGPAGNGYKVTSGGSTLGALISMSDGVFTFISAGKIFTVDAVTGAYKLPATPIYFLSPDCTGQAYVAPRFGSQVAFTVPAAVAGSTWFTWSGAAQTVTVGAVINDDNGVCDVSADGVELSLRAATPGGLVPSDLVTAPTLAP